MDALHKSKVHDALVYIQGYLMKYAIPKLHYSAAIKICDGYTLNIFKCEEDDSVKAGLCFEGIYFALLGPADKSSLGLYLLSNLDFGEVLVGYWPKVKQRILDEIREQEEYKQSVEDFHI